MLKPRWPEPYEQLADAMAQLRARFPNSVLLGASIVHPRHSIPPEHLGLLSDIHEKTPFVVPSLGNLVKKTLICFLSALVDFFVYSFLRLRFASATVSDKPVSVLMKTWVPGSSALSKPADFYYGTLADQLKSNSENALLLAGDGRSDDGRLPSKLRSLAAMFGFARAALNSGDRYFPETLLVSPSAPLAAAFKQVCLAFKIRAWVLTLTDDVAVLKRVAAQTCLDVLRPYTTKNLMQAHIAENAVLRWDPKAVITFYEGQPWEKLFWGAAKKISPAICLVGYQHTVIMPHAFAVTKPRAISGEISAPDIVLCTGETTQKIIAPGHAGFGTRFLVFGTHRRSGGQTPAKLPRPQQKTILVLPEGILTEAVALFDFAMEVAANLPDHKILFRCHPVLPFEKVTLHLKHQINEFSNIELSTQPNIQFDFERSSCLIYRGSSAVFYSVLSGVKPFCWADPGGPNVDPLGSLPGWRSYIEEGTQAVKEIQAYSTCHLEDISLEWREAADFVDGYVRSEDARAVKDLANIFDGWNSELPLNLTAPK